MFCALAEYAYALFDVLIYFVGDVEAVKHTWHESSLDRGLLYTKTALGVEAEKSTAFLESY